MGWREDGVALKVELATTGDVIENGTEYPQVWTYAVSNGPPAGWTGTRTNQATSQAAATQLVGFWEPGSWDIEGAGAPTAVGDYWGGFAGSGAYINTMAGYRYRMNIMVRLPPPTLGAYTPGKFQVYLDWIDAGGAFLYGDLAAADTVPNESNWVAVSSRAYDRPANATRVRARVLAGALDSTIASWGVEFKEMTMIAQPVNAPTTVWRDITCDVKSLSTRNGRERFTDRYDVAAAQLVLYNGHGDYAYYPPGQVHPFGLSPGRRVKITATYPGEVNPFPMYFGIIDTIIDGYDLDGRAITTFNLLDPSTLFTSMPTPYIYWGNFTQQLSGIRIAVLMDATGYIYLPGNIGAGQWQTQPVRASGRNLRDELGVTADSEGGAFFINRQGNPEYWDRAYSSEFTQNATANFLAQPSGIATPPNTGGFPDHPDIVNICVSSLNTDWSRNRVINVLTLANQGGTGYFKKDIASINRNGVFTYQRTDFVLSPPTSTVPLSIRANDYLNGYKDPKLRVNSVTYHPSKSRDSVDNWPFTLSAFLGWKIRVWYRHPVEGWGWAIVNSIQSVEHRITVNDWEVTMSLDQASYWVHWGATQEFQMWEQSLELAEGSDLTT